ncbi:MAG: phage terminase large subunit [Ignavibacteriales bacterium]|nr:phage terminase large subunit [Ignavibacteriales bacterium]
MEALIEIEREKRRRLSLIKNDPLRLEREKEILEARKSFWSFCVFVDTFFFAAEKRPHLFKIAYKLQQVENGEIKKLMISLPPRGGKSYIISMWCSWMLGKHPEGSIMRNSYGQDLANKFSYDIRAIIQLPVYKEVFPHVKLRPDRKDVVDWAIQTSKQSAYFCAGVGGAITGKGCDLAAILDDPIKNIEDAMSETILKKTWQWYTAVHKARLEKGCPEIHIATRWSRKDPIGMLKASEPNEWEEIKIAALNDKGETFCESIKSTEEYAKMKNILDGFIWEAEFMQNPIESKGLLFPAEELNRFSLDEVKKYEENKQETWDAIVGYTDTADEGADFLSSPTGKVKGEKIFITDVVFTQDPIEITEPLVAQMIIDTKQNKHTVESNSGGKSFAINVQEIIQGKAKCIINWQQQTKNKETRILMKSGQIKKYFYFRNDYQLGSDYDKFMRQLTSYVRFGKNTHDDAPDSVTGLAEIVFAPNAVEFL